jgi:chemotaxis protein methyltransferase CheR
MVQAIIQPDREFEFIVLADHKRNMVYSRISRRLRSLGLRRCEDYIAMLERPDSDDEMLELINLMTTNLTHFFRENHHFEFMRSLFAPGGPMAAQKRIRIWSAGCSAGMEAWSAAITLAEAVPDFQKRDIRILATDIDTHILERGRNATYRREDIKDLPDDLRRRYFNDVGNNGMRISDHLHGMVSFRPLNLMHNDWPMRGPFQLIFCRNVMIYFDKETQKQLAAKFIGHSENLSGMHPKLKLNGRTIYRNL